MRFAALLVATVTALVYLGGCSQPPDTSEPPKPRNLQFDLVVRPFGVVELYTLNNGNMSRVAVVPFELQGEETARVPGPEIRAREGDTVTITLRNENILDHTFHLHGGLIPWEMDGVDYLTQMPIEPQEVFTYTFADLKAGTYWYHCHVDGAHHIDLGMYGAFIVEEADPPKEADREFVLLLDEMDNCHVHGNTEPVDPRTSERSGAVFSKNSCAERFLQDWLAQNQIGNTAANSASPYTQDTICPQLQPDPNDPPDVAQAKAESRAALGCDSAHGHGNPPPQQQRKTWWPDTMPVYTPFYNTYLVNGKAFPDTPVLPVREGETIRIRLINAGNQAHSFHPHGHTMSVEYRDGYALGTAAFRADTLSIGPGERYDIFIEMDNPGLWMVHDQNGITNMNDDQHPGGMMTCLAYDGFRGIDAFGMQRALDCNTRAMEIMGHGH